MNTTPQAPALTADDIPMEFTLDGLREHFSDEEIAAMNDGDDPILPGVDLTAKRDTSGTQAEDDGEVLDDTAGQVQEAPPAQAAPIVNAEPDPEPPPPIPVDVSAHRKTVEELDAKIEALQQEYDDGDLTSAEWRAHLAQVVKEQAAAQAALNTAEAMAAEVAPKAEAYRQAWYDKVAAYQAQHDYLGSDAHFDAWDAALKMVNTNAAYAKLGMTQRIEQAHRIYAAHYEGLEGKPLPTKPGLTTAQKAQQQAAPKPRTDPRPEAPITLANLTNAADNGIEDGRFAQIERIMETDPLKAEAMIAAMSDQDRYDFLNI